MCDFFVHNIGELQGNDSTSQAPIDLNGPLHSNWVNLLEIISHPVTSKQHVHLIAQNNTTKKDFGGDS
jgi:hypothetical protein